MNDGRALQEHELEKIQQDIYAGLYNDRDIAMLFQTIYVQRRVLRELFNFFKREPLRLVSTADPIRNSVLAHLKECVSMEER